VPQFIAHQHVSLQGKRAYIIGGGPSLLNFDWQFLQYERKSGAGVIGCNDAYLLGSDICNVCVFGDREWLNKHQKRLKHFPGLIVTNLKKVSRRNLPWLYSAKRKGVGLGVNNELGWNGNTGCLAINLALVLGASPIYLLGFDMKLSPKGENNWHSNDLCKARTQIFEKFKRGMATVERWRKKMFPDQKVYNVTDDSDLDVFPKIKIKELIQTVNASLVGGAVD